MAKAIPLLLMSAAAMHSVSNLMRGMEQSMKPPPRLHARHRLFAEEALPSLDSYDVVIVGAGLSGAVLAERHANVLGHRVLVLEKRDHIAGNCFDYVDEESGIRVSKYGAHLFHTNSQKVWDYVKQFGAWVRWDHRVLAYVQGRHVNMPVNINTVNSLFNSSIANPAEMDEWLQKVQVDYGRPPANSEEMAKSRIGKDLYEVLIEPYTRKQWNCSPAELHPSVAGRIPVRSSFDDRYFSDRHQFLPLRGYTEVVQSMLASDKVDVRLGVEFSPQMLGGFRGVTYYTGPIDQYFAFSHERLQYRSLRFERTVVKHQKGTVLPASVVNYPSSDVDYTRVVEYKHFLGQKSDHTVLFYEYSTDVGDPYYPVPTKRNHDLYEEYRQMALKETYSKNIWFVGRLANYKYFNMDEAIGNALHYFDTFADLHVVLSVYEEDLSWTSQICDAVGSLMRVAWFVYVKKAGRDVSRELQTAACNTVHVNISHLPNLGREGHSWATYITSVARPGRRVAFMQGGVDKARKGDWASEIVRSLSASDEPFISLSAPPGGPPSGIFVGDTLNDWLLCCGIGESATKLAQQVSGEGVDMRKLEHNFRGEFIVFGTNVLQVHRVFGEKFLQEWMPAMTASDAPIITHAFERLWVEIFRQGRLKG